MAATRDPIEPSNPMPGQVRRAGSFRMKKNLLVALVSKREEMHRDLLQDLFSKQIKRGSRFRPFHLTGNEEVGGTDLEKGNGFDVFHIWEKEETTLPPLPNVLPQVVVCSLPAGETGTEWLRFFKSNDYYMLLVCLDAHSASAAIHFDPTAYLKTQETCQTTTGAWSLAAGYPGEMRKQVYKNLRDFIIGWYVNRIKRRERL